ncbi:MAG: hypothetical protein HUJ95_00925 [Bacteroidales bacterium]|nr:hypothetical protein [Bacteroidales bacterium]
MKGSILASLVLAFCVSFSSFAQNAGPQERFLQRVASQPVSLDFEISQEGVAGIIARGSVLYYNNRYFIQSDVYRVYCDSVSKYTVDDYTQEACYEKIDTTSRDLFTNPSLLFTALSSDVSYVFPEKKDIPTGAKYTDASSGNTYIFVLSNVRFQEAVPSDDEFRPAELGPKYVITDLRNE